MAGEGGGKGRYGSGPLDPAGVTVELGGGGFGGEAPRCEVRAGAGAGENGAGSTLHLWKIVFLGRCWTLDDENVGIWFELGCAWGRWEG